MHKEPRNDVSGLHVITTKVRKRKRDHEDVASAAALCGARIIQFRDKDMNDDDFKRKAECLRDIAHDAGAAFIINDRANIAEEIGADGVHVGQSDEDVVAIRLRVSESMIVGASAGSVAEAIAAEKDGADYIGAGPVFYTGSKEDAAKPIGLYELKKICESVELPVIAIGGINAENTLEVMKTGAAGVAVISAIAEASDMIAAVREMKRMCETKV